MRRRGGHGFDFDQISALKHLPVMIRNTVGLLVGAARPAKALVLRVMMWNTAGYQILAMPGLTVAGSPAGRCVIVRVIVLLFQSAGVVPTSLWKSNSCGQSCVCHEPTPAVHEVDSSGTMAFAAHTVGCRSDRWRRKLQRTLGCALLETLMWWDRPKDMTAF